MEPADKMTEYIKKADVLFGLFSLVGVLITQIYNFPNLFYVFLTLAWLSLIIWLLPIARNKKRTSGLLQTGKTYTEPQKKWALSILILTSVSYLGIVSWKINSEYQQHRPPELHEFLEEKYGIIIAEFFTIDSSQEKVNRDNSGIRERLFDDFYRLIKQESLDHRVELQQAGVIRDEDEAKIVGKKYNADMVIWGDVRPGESNIFRPHFTITTESEFLDQIDPILFNFDIVGKDSDEELYLLASRVRSISSFVIGMLYLNEGGQRSYEAAVTSFTRAISETTDELKISGESKDVAYTLSLQYLMRGRSYELLGENDKALKDYYNALDFTPDSERIITAIAIFYHNQGDLGNADLFYKKAIHYWRANYGLGILAFNRNDFETALGYFYRAFERRKFRTETTKEDLFIQRMLGLTYKRLGDNEKAIELLSDLCFNENIPNDVRSNSCLELTPWPTQTQELYTSSPTFVSRPSTSTQFLTETTTPTVSINLKTTPTYSISPTMEKDDKERPTDIPQPPRPKPTEEPPPPPPTEEPPISPPYP